MSLIVNELGQVLYRIVVLCPTRDELRERFETLSFELTTHKGLESKKLDLAAASLGNDRAQAWLSFNLGRRANLDLRVSLVGFSADRKLPSSAMLSACDGICIHASVDSEHIEAILAIKIEPEARRLPLLVTGLDEIPDDLRKRALEEWLKRGFSQVFALRRDQEFLGAGIEWYLIH